MNWHNFYLYNINLFDASSNDKASSFGRSRYWLAIRMIGDAKRPKLPSSTWCCW